jgi:UDP-N-acetylglucosamine acyltransferase
VAIHPTAIIEQGARLGENVTVGPFAFISAQATIGANTVIKNGACIYNKTTIGSDCEIGSYTILGEMPQSIGHDKSVPVELIIGDRNKIKEYVLISLGTHFADKKTVIGNDNYIMAYVHIGHDCVVGDGNVMANATNVGGHVHIGDKNVFGAMTAVHQFVELGSYCMFGGASAITQDIPPYVLAEGNRAVIRGLNIIGLKRNFGSDAVKGLKQTFKTLFRSGRALKESAQQLLESGPDAYTKNMCEFIIRSKRGIPFERIEKEGETDAN